MAITDFRMYRLLERHSGWITLAGAVLLLVYGLKFLQFSGTLGDASPQNTQRLEVRLVKPASCGLLGNNRAQYSNVELSCLDVSLSPPGSAESDTPLRISVSKNHTGDLARGSLVYVAYAQSLGSYVIINAAGPAGFWWEKEAPLYLAISGFVLLCLSLVVRFRAAPEKPAAARSEDQRGGGAPGPA